MLAQRALVRVTWRCAGARRTRRASAVIRTLRKGERRVLLSRIMRVRAAAAPDSAPEVLLRNAPYSRGCAPGRCSADTHARPVASTAARRGIPHVAKGWGGGEGRRGAAALPGVLVR